MKTLSGRKGKALFLAGTLFSVHFTGLLAPIAFAAPAEASGKSAKGQPLSPDADGSLSEKEKADIRKSWKNNPEQAEIVIKALEARRKETAEYRSNPDNMRQELMALVDRLGEHNKSGDTQFQQVWMDLDKKLQLYQAPEPSQRLSMPPNLGNELAERLIDIFNKRRSYMSHGGTFDIKIAGQYGNSRKVKDHLVAILANSDQEKRTAALMALTRSRTMKKDSEMYAAVERLYQREGEQNEDILPVLQSIDREKALAEIVKLTDTTKNLRTFQGASSMISAYHRTDLLEHVLNRMNDFPKQGRGTLKNPTIGIDPQLFLQYVKESEGEKLKIGLGALRQTARAYSQSYPIIKSKLKSPDAVSRGAAVEFLHRGFAEDIFVSDEALKDLQQMEQSEGDPDVKKKVSTATQTLKTRLKAKR